MNKRYFDYAAATPLDPAVFTAMKPFFEEEFHNPSAMYLSAQKNKKLLEEARGCVAEILAVQKQTITFTAGVTEANNIFLQGMALTYSKSHMLISAIEHESVFGVVDGLKQRGLIEYDLIPVDKNGHILLDQLNDLIKDNTTAISVIHVHNEFGSIQDLSAISKIVKQVRARRKMENNELPLLLHSDAAQTANYLPVTINTLGVDAMSISAAKLYGPKQVGVLYTGKEVKLKPLLLGGEQEHGLRAGTQNTASAVAMAESLKIAQKQRDTENVRLKELDKYLRDGLRKIACATIHVMKARRVPSLTSVDFEGVDAERLVMELDEKGIELGRGSACNAGSGEPSKSLVAIGLSESAAQSTIRIALGRQTTKEDVQYLLETIEEIVTKKA